jgi:hypothetical protein
MTGAGCRVSLLRALTLAVLPITACATSDATAPDADTRAEAVTDVSGVGRPDPDAALALLAGSPSPYAIGADRWELWVCRVPVDTTAALFADDPWRLDTDAAALAVIVDDGVARWWSQRSHGLYRPIVTAGGTVTVATDGDDQDCVASAIANSSSETNGVIVVATAAHGPGVPGGWGRPGACAAPCVPTTVSESGRAVYVGATDFHPSWGDRPPLDLLQHEMGHALDLPHSATTTTDDTGNATVVDGTADGTDGVDGGDVVYESAIDVMSDSAAPRSIDPDRRDGADTLGANRVALGWLPLTDVVVVARREDSTEQQVILAPSSSPDPGPRLALVPLDATRLLTIELRVHAGPDAHIDDPGISVHLVDQSPRPDEAGCTATACTGQHRVQRPLVGAPPYLDLLTAGEQIEVEGWRIRVVEVSSTTSRVALTPV